MSEASGVAERGPMIRMQVRNLEVELADGGQKILRDVSFDLEAGKIFALVGESGSGKEGAALIGPDPLRSE